MCKIMKQKRYMIPLLLLLAACQPSQSDLTPLAKVGENFLYLEDVKKVLPENMTETDSALWMDDFN